VRLDQLGPVDTLLAAASDKPLALAAQVAEVPATRALREDRRPQRAKLTAELRWGKKREELSFSLELAQARSSEASPARDEVQALIDAFADHQEWRAELAQEVLELPGIGLCVPDLSFTHQGTGELVLCEVLGFWNRAAVWRRIELVEQGLASKIVFVVSARLRVSEELLDGADSAALYVYKGAINPKALQRKLDELAASASPKPSARAARKK